LGEVAPAIDFIEPRGTRLQPKDHRTFRCDANAIRPRCPKRLDWSSRIKVPSKLPQESAMTRLQAHRARVVQRHLERSLLARVLGVLAIPIRTRQESREHRA
jgi:hypothetical protein